VRLDRRRRLRARFERFHWPKRLWQQRERMLALARGEVAVSDERLEALEPPTRQALAALAPGCAKPWPPSSTHRAPSGARQGRDTLGLPPGPRVGAVLAQLEAARARHARTELELAARCAIPGEDELSARRDRHRWSP
jgi:hypothetical protein